MSGVLLDQASHWQSVALLGSYACATVWESIAARRPFAMPLGARWAQQLALTALGSFLTRLCVPLTMIALALWAQQHHWGLFHLLPLPAWMALLAGVLLLDLADYVQHRLFHAVPWLWRIHRVHHSDLDVDCGTALRHHPIEMLLNQALGAGIIIAFGLTPEAVLVASLIGTVAATFNHANVALPARWERYLRRLFVTPDLHRVHHSADAHESNKNFANVLLWWDRLGGTYLDGPARGQPGMWVGLTELRRAADLTLAQLLLLPLRPRVLTASSDGVSACADHRPAYASSQGPQEIP